MTIRRLLAAIAASVLLGACASTTPTVTTLPASGDDRPGSPAAVLDQARDVADQLNQREADLESMIP